MQKITRESDIATSIKLNASHFVTIFKVFKPERDVHQADMTVTLIFHLLKILYPYGLDRARWMTPISFLIQSLAYARRYSEVKYISAKYPGLKMGPKKESVSSFLVRISGDEREKPQNESDYEKLIESLTKKWMISR